jgi:hypothetical protein
VTASVRSSGNEAPGFIVAVEGNLASERKQFFDQHQSPLPPMTWATVHIEATVDATARVLALEVYPSSDDKVWLDDISISPL